MTTEKKCIVVAKCERILNAQFAPIRAGFQHFSKYSDKSVPRSVLVGICPYFQTFLSGVKNIRDKKADKVADIRRVIW